MNDTTNPNRTEPPAAGLTVLRIVWAALLMGEGTFLLILIKILLPNQTIPRDPQPILSTISFAMCGTAIPVAFIVRKMTFKTSRQKRGTLTVAAYSTGNIIFWAACDGVAFFGLVAALMNGTLWPTIVSVGIAMGLQVMTFPRWAAVNGPEYPPAG